jgi:cellulose synthase/poly-beta-1,6-N-acetylglucosamine synthase-like glycosyltransferase
MANALISERESEDYFSISIIVITYNEEKNIRDCLDSLIMLDYPKDKYEIIIVDASKDSTPLITESFKDVKLIRSIKGFSQQRNIGIKSTSFDILAFTDADCIVSSDWLKVINRVFKNKEIAAIGGNGYPPPKTGYFGKCVACIGHPSGGAVGFDSNVTRGDRGVDFMPGCNSAFKRKVLLNVGGFDPFFYDGGEDVDISRRIRQKGYYIDYIPELTVYHKPRTTLMEFIRWNIQVGITKYNIKRPSLIKLIFQPSFPLWSALFFSGLFFLFVNMSTLFIASLFILWPLSIIFLLFMAKPYSLLIKRRRKIGIDLFSIFTVIPFLIYVRQICINIGQIKKYYILKSKKSPL